MKITMDEAKVLMEKETGYVVLDVRTEGEYNEGHIPGAMNIPNEGIGNAEIKILPDKNQLIFVYCKSGIRSKQAYDKLVALGYTNIKDIGGIMDWDGALE